MKQAPKLFDRWKKTGGVLLTVALVAALCGGCGGKEGLPKEYSVAGQSIPALTVPEGGNMAETDEKIYAYEGVESSGDVAKSYVTQLTGADGGFVIVDETYTQVSVPDFGTEEGGVLLAKDADGETEEESEEVTSEVSSQASQTEEQETTSQEESADQEPEDWLITVQVDWAPEECIITTSKVAGTITYPEVDSVSVIPAMTEEELVNYVKSLSPADLGLEGDSMESYRVYTITGNVYVDGRQCSRVQVYSRDNPSETNHFEGLYLISGDGRIYRMDPDTDAVTPISAS